MDESSGSDILINSVHEFMEEEPEQELEGDIDSMEETDEAEVENFIENIADAVEEVESSGHTESFGQSSGSLEVLEEHEEKTRKDNRDMLLGDLNLSNCSAQQEDSEAETNSSSSSDSSDSDSSDSGGSESDSEEEQEQENSKEVPGDLEVPMAQGWRRQCMTWEGQVVRVYYLSPPGGRAGTCRRLQDKRGLKKFLTCLAEEGGKPLTTGHQGPIFAGFSEIISVGL